MVDGAVSMDPGRRTGEGVDVEEVAAVSVEAIYHPWVDVVEGLVRLIPQRQEEEAEEVVVIRVHFLVAADEDLRR